MKPTAFLPLAFSFTLALAQTGTTTAVVTPPTTQVVVIPPTIVTRSATIQLGSFPGISELPLPPRPPTTLTTGTRLQIIAPEPGVTHGPVQWFKDSTRLAATGATLDFSAVTADDAGSYSAFVKNPDGTTSQSDFVTLHVTARARPRVINASTRARLETAQSSLLTGFVVEPGAGVTSVLLRAVGPTLAAFGVTDALAAPRLRVFGSRGQEIPPPNLLSPLVPSAAGAARNAGAFPLPAGSKDVAQFFYLGPGVYTAQVTSADGGSGTVLLEIYEVP